MEKGAAYSPTITVIEPTALQLVRHHNKAETINDVSYHTQWQHFDESPVSELAVLCAVICRLICLTLSNTFHPSAAQRSAQISEVDSEKYHRRMQHWNQKQAGIKKLRVCADNPGLEHSTSSVVT